MCSQHGDNLQWLDQGMQTILFQLPAYKLSPPCDNDAESTCLSSEMESTQIGPTEKAFEGLHGLSWTHVTLLPHQQVASSESPITFGIDALGAESRHYSRSFRLRMICRVLMALKTVVQEHSCLINQITRFNYRGGTGNERI